MSETPPTPPAVMMSPPGARVVVDGREFDYFGGTGYLGLQGHPEVIEAACRAVRAFGVHTATSRTRFESQPVRNVERLVAEVFGTEAGFYFPSGYMGAALLVQMLRDRVDGVFVDSAAHYSVTEAARLAGVPVLSFASRDPEDLRRRVHDRLGDSGVPLVLTDGVFPSFGWIAPIDRYVTALADSPGAAIVVDDAHGFGVLGEHGRGTLDHLGLFAGANRGIPDGPVRGCHLFAVGTASKAFGGHGGILPGDRALIDRATRAAHYYDGASAPAAPVAAATARALQIFLGGASSAGSLRADLRRNVARVRDGLRELGVANEDLPTPIVGFDLGDAAAMQRLHDDLARRGILVPYAASYSGLGPAGAMRLAVFATHSEEQIDRLLATLREVLPR